MLTHQSIGAGRHDPGVTSPATPCGRRAALYLSSADGTGEQSTALIDCAWQARQEGLRVVTVVAEDGVKAGHVHDAGLGGSRLRALVGRLAAGQFDVIVAHTGDVMITIGAPTQIHQGEAT